jgi:hypothetical protein
MPVLASILASGVVNCDPNFRDTARRHILCAVEDYVKNKRSGRQLLNYIHMVWFHDMLHIFSLHHNAHTGSVTHPASYLVDTFGYFYGSAVDRKGGGVFAA